MKRCLMPILSRTGARLPGALFIGNRLHAILPLDRKADGYEALISPELQAYLDSEAVQSQGVALSDLDAPRARPLLYSQDGGWGSNSRGEAAAAAVAHDLAVAALRQADIWPIDSISTLVVTLLAMGYDPDALAHAIYIDLLERPADPGGLNWLSRQLRRRAAQVSDAIFGIIDSTEFLRLRQSLNEPRGGALRMLLSVVRHCHTPGYKQALKRPPVLSLADYSPTVALTGGWWKPVGQGPAMDYWSSYSAAVVVRPPAPGRWTFRAVKSERDAGIALKRWRTTGEPGLESRLTESGDAIELAFDSPGGAALALEFETDSFFIPSVMVPGSRDHRSLALGFREFSVEASI